MYCTVLHIRFKTFKGNFVNLALQSLHWGSIKITLTLPLIRQSPLNYAYTPFNSTVPFKLRLHSL